MHTRPFGSPDPYQLSGSGQSPSGYVGAKRPLSALRFRRFDVVPGERLLLCDGKRIEIGSRAFDLLIILLRSRGHLVTRAEIVRHVWPDTVVAESNLRFQMACLRAVLQEDRDAIMTIPRRGYLLVADADEEGRPAKALDPFPAHRSPRTPVTNPLVVVIDDDRDTREALEGLLRSAGWFVEIFASVQAFIDSKRDTPPQCLILDVWMPGRSGLEFQADLAKAGHNVPVIFISGHADVPMSVRAMKAGALEFLTKPVRHEELLEAIERAIAPWLNETRRELPVGHAEAR